MTEQLFSALKAIETLSSGTMKFYGLLSGARAWTAGIIWPEPQARATDMARVTGEDHVILAV